MLAFPTTLPKPVSGGFAQSVKSLSGGQSLTGFEQVQSSMSDRWTASYTFSINSDARVLAFRAFVLSMRGRGNTVLLPAFDLARAPWALDGFGRKQTPGLFRNPQLDGTPYQDPANQRDGLIAAQVRIDAGLNAGALDIQMTKGSAPQPGHLFSIGNKLYSVLTVTAMGGTRYIIGIWPWLRTDVAAGAAINFATPACEMRFASDGEGADALSKLSQLRFANITLTFDEVA